MESHYMIQSEIIVNNDLPIGNEVVNKLKDLGDDIIRAQKEFGKALAGLDSSSLNIEIGRNILGVIKKAV